MHEYDYRCAHVHGGQPLKPHRESRDEDYVTDL